MIGNELNGVGWEVGRGGLGEGHLRGAVGRKLVQQGGSQEGLMLSPQSKFEVWCCGRMCRASRTLLLQ